MRQIIQSTFENLQNEICHQLEKLELQSNILSSSTAKFREDLWQHREKGGGKTRILEGKTIEKGGVNFSAVEGKLPDMLKNKLNIHTDSYFFATGISIVLHPVSPICPIIHANIRYFETDQGIFWFGGGIDLSPHYIDRNLAQKFHTQLKKTCDLYDSSYYPDFKKQADDYFFLPHRAETRGVGGIFFDYLGYNDRSAKTKSQLFDFVKAVGTTFFPAYQEQILTTAHLPYSEEDKKWQALRRGRYVEFNLLWDRGTKFGLETHGRTESILMSLPKNASWEYCYDFSQNKKAVETQGLLKKEIDWMVQ